MWVRIPPPQLGGTGSNQLGSRMGVVHTATHENPLHRTSLYKVHTIHLGDGMARFRGGIGIRSALKMRRSKEYVGSNPTGSTVIEINKLRKWWKNLFSLTPLKTTMMAGGYSSALVEISDEVIDHDKVIMKSPTSKVGESRFKPQ